MTAMFPLATVPMATAPGPSPQSSAFNELIKSQAPGQYLLEIVAYKGGESRSGGIAGLAEIPLATVPPGGGISVGQVTLRYGDKHWVGAPSDSQQPNVYYEGRVTVPLVMERVMPILPEEPRRVQRQFGMTEIANGDGALDSILQSYAVDGRRVRVLFGPLGAKYSDFVVIADVLGTGWSGNELTVSLGLRDQSYSLDLPLQTNLYEGTGDDEGTAELEGKPKPLCFGIVRNITPVLVDPTNLIYQIHDGEIEAIDDVFDRGAALTDSSVDVADYAALVAQSVPAANFATAKAVGMFKLGSSPDGLITCDARGDVDPDYADTIDVIALRILRNRAGLDVRWINTATFAGVGAIAGEMGLYLPHTASPTTSDVMNVLMASVGGWWGAARDGRIRAGRLTAPEDRSVNLYLDQYNILALEPVEAPVPRWRQRVAYRPNWTEQRGEDLAGSVTAERRQFLTEKDRAVSAADAVVRVRHLQALDPAPLQTLFDSSTDAQTLGDYLLALHSPDRQMFRVTLKRLGYQLDLQSIVRVTWPRLGLRNGKNFAVVGIREDADQDATIITIWG